MAIWPDLSSGVNTVTHTRIAYPRRMPDFGGRPDTPYLETDLGYLAYQVFGEGERDILFVTGALTNLDVLWDEPSAVRFFDRLAAMGRVITYDMRGSGVSDPIRGSSKWLPIEANVSDVRAVLDAAGSDRAVAYGDTDFVAGSRLRQQVHKLAVA